MMIFPMLGVLSSLPAIALSWPWPSFFRLWKSARPKANKVSDSSVMVSIERNDWVSRLLM
ncbi:hypothetical protein D3C87_2063480 [compost metagenome]